MAMAVVRPTGIEFDVADGESVMDAARRAGYRWPTICGGMGDCTICAVDVLHSLGPLPPPSSKEESQLRILRAGPIKRADPRLACQLKIASDIEVFKRAVVREARDDASHDDAG